MENEIVASAASYGLIRVGILLTLGYMFYRILQPKRVSAQIRRERTPALSKADRVPEDRC